MDKIEIKNSSTKPIEGVVPSKEYSDYTIKSTQIEDNVEKFFSMRLGTYEEAPKFIQDNEYLKTGYFLIVILLKKFLKVF